MTTYKQIKFNIDHLDPMGQGVFKNNDQIYFIPKTLPGETGTAMVLKSSKGVNFASVIALEKESPERITPHCPHYQSCHGCHFQHTNYPTELESKKIALSKHLQKLRVPAIEIISNQQRYQYRNRVQLHYNKKKNTIGYINPRTKEIISIEQCPLANTEVSQNLKVVLSDWKAMAPNSFGHVEITETDITWNQAYSSSGFSQVNSKMNTMLTQLVKEHAEADGPKNLLDLFSGSGNLSKKIKCSQKILIDMTQYQMTNYFQMDLYQADALAKFQSQHKDLLFDTIILDPPRKGFPQIKDWIEKYPSQTLIYISCNASTMARDLVSLSSYHISHLYLLDMFPSTFHFETIAVLKSNQ